MQLINKFFRYAKIYGILLAFIYAINKIRAALFNRRLKKIFNVNLINIDPSVRLIGISNISIGNNFRAGKDFWLEAVLADGALTYNPKIIIKDNVIINDNVHIGSTNYLEIGNNVLMASKIYISDHNHGSYFGNNQSSPDTPPSARSVSCDKCVIIGDNVWIGEFVSILPGVTIGRGSIIGSNSVVAKSIPPNCIAVGSPAKVVKKYNYDKSEWEPYTL